MTTTQSGKTEALGQFKISILTHVEENAPPPGKRFWLDKGTLKSETNGSRVACLVMTATLTLEGLATCLRDEKNFGAKTHLVSGLCEHDFAVAYSEKGLARAKAEKRSTHKLGDNDYPLVGFGAAAFQHRPGPGVMVVDTDGVQKVAVITQLEDAVPGMSSFARVEKASSSSLISTTAGKELRGLGGQHTFFAVMDATDLPRALKVLSKRLVLSGHAKFKIGEAGTILDRTAVDIALCGPSQPIFIRATIGEGLKQDLSKTVVFHEGLPMIDTREVIRDLTEAEEREYQVKAAEARAPLLDEAQKVRTAHLDTLAKKEVERTGGKTSHAEATAKIVQAMTTGVLGPKATVELSDGSMVTVADIMAAPTVYHRKSCRDPLEPWYGSPTVATIFTDNDYPNINSKAHNGRIFRLVAEFPAWSADTVEAELAEMDALDCLLSRPAPVVSPASEEFSTPEALNDPVVKKIMSEARAVANAAAAALKLKAEMGGKVGNTGTAGLWGIKLVKAGTAKRKGLSNYKPQEQIIGGGTVVKGVGGISAGMGGTGKSLRQKALLLSAASGLPLLGYPVYSQVNSIYINNDDTTETLEKRFGAIAAHYGVPESAMDRIHIIGSDVIGGHYAAQQKTNGRGLEINWDFWAWLEAKIKEVGSEIEVLDTLVGIADIVETDNGQMGLFSSTVNLFAQRTNTCVTVVHHANKGGQKSGPEGTGRSAVSIAGGLRAIDKLRYAEYINDATPEEIAARGLDPYDPNLGKVVAVTVVKNSHGPIGGPPEIFRLVSYDLQNSSGVYPSDKMGVPVHLPLKKVAASDAVLMGVLKAIKTGGANGDALTTMKPKDGASRDRYAADCVRAAVDWAAEGYEEGKSPPDVAIIDLVKTKALRRGLAREQKVMVSYGKGNGQRERSGLVLTAAGDAELNRLQNGGPENPFDGS